MDITQFVVSARNKALLYGDYSTYRTQLAHRLLSCRKRLRVATRHRGKYNHRANAATAEQISEDADYARLQLLTAERAYAQAMAMKAAHAASKKGNITGHTRSHIVSRLDKAARYAEGLARVLEDAASGATDTDRLEASAYAALLRGAAAFEKQAWAPCLVSYATVWAVYSALSRTPARADVFRDLLADTIEPSLRYAAYQLKMPRSKPLPIIAREALLGAEDKTSSTVVAAVNEIDPAILQPKTTATAAADTEASDGGGGGIVASTRTLTWRARAIQIQDAAIASAWAALDVAKARLAARLTAGGARMAPKDMAAAYDDVLTASQDVVDATKDAIGDLHSEGLSPSDPGMQVLYIARTAANYEMISDRIGRNRVLTGPHDGAETHLDATAKKARKRKSSSAEAGAAATARPEAPGRFIARLKEKVVLYDGTLQSLESIKELPGVAADAELTEQLDATSQYFTALKSLAIARSHTVAGNAANALALVKHGHKQCAEAAPVLAKVDQAAPEAAASSLRSIHVATADVQFLEGLLQDELQRARALVDIETQQQQQQAQTGAQSAPPLPLSGFLGTYPSTPVDLAHIVAYPPRLEPMPVKPIFLDIAWNYIAYPDKATAAAGGARAGTAAGNDAGGAAKQAGQPQQAQPAQKRGWFGFGR